MKVSSSLCQRCRVLQFNDAEHGTVEGWRRGEDMVVFDKFDKEGPRCEVMELQRQAIFLDYDLSDNLPDLPALSASGASGCGMCFAMREKIVQLERRADTKHKNVLIYKFCLRYMITVLKRPSTYFPTLTHLAVHFKLIGDQNNCIPYTVSFDVQAETGGTHSSKYRLIMIHL